MAEPDDKHNDDKDRREGGDTDREDKKGNAETSDKDADGEEPDDEDDEPSGPPLYKRPLFWIIGGGVLILVIVGGLLWWLHARQFESTDDAFVDAHIVRLAPEVSGRLVAVAGADNRHVKAGKLLAVIEPDTPQAQREEAVAAVGQAVAAIRQAQAQVDAAKATRRQAAANAVSPAAQAAKAARDLARYEALLRLDPAAVAGQQVDAARATARDTAAQARAARREVATQDANVRVARRQVDAQRAQLAASRARVTQVDVTIGNLRLHAPVDGQVVNRTVNIGSYVGPGQQVMAIVPDRYWVTANFKETQITRMRPGQHVDIRVDAFPDVHFEGHVDSIQRGAGQTFALLPPQNATGNYVKVVQRVPVRIYFDRPDPRHWAIGPGMSVVPRVKVR